MRAVPPATKVLIYINLVVWFAQIASNGALTDWLYYTPVATLVEPWRMITSGFAHSANLAGDPTGSILHIGLNMYSLYLIGIALEPIIGWLRFTYLYLLSLLGGSVAVLWFASPVSGVVGASGAIFGLMGAYFVVLRTLRAQSNQILYVIAFNLFFTFMNSGISWEAHIGGLFTGALVALIYAQTRSLAQAKLQNTYLAILFAALIGLSFIRATNLLS